MLELGRTDLNKQKFIVDEMVSNFLEAYQILMKLVNLYDKHSCLKSDHIITFIRVWWVQIRVIYFNNRDHNFSKQV